MSDIDVYAICRRDRLVVLTGLAGITLRSWVYMTVNALRMAAAPMRAMAMAQWRPWGRSISH